MKFDVPIENDSIAKEIIKQYKEILDAPEFKIENQEPPKGLHVDLDADGCPVIPDDITAISPVSLGQVFQAAQAWHEYVLTQLSNIDTRRTILQEALESLTERIKEMLSQKGVPESRYKADMRFIELNREVLTAKLKVKHWETRKASSAGRVRMLSREITRRGDEMEFSGMNPSNRFKRQLPGRFGGDAFDAS